MSDVPATAPTTAPAAVEEKAEAFNVEAVRDRWQARMDANYGKPHSGEKVDAKTAPKADDVDVQAKPGDKPADAKPEAKADDVKVTEAVQRAVAEKEAVIARHEQKLGEWDELGEQIAARFDTLKADNTRLRKMLAEAGVSDDPRDVEIMRLRESDNVRKMQDERMRAIVAQQEQAERAARDRAQSEANQQQLQAIVAKHPHLNLTTDIGRSFWQTVYNGGDPLPAAVAARIAERFKAPEEAPNVAKPLRNTGAVGGGAQPRTFDPYDVAEKWRRKLAG